MKHISKQPEPPELIAWKALENENWKPSYSDLSSREKKVIKQALMAEQGNICCYCERRLDENDSHIEHFKPQHHEGVDPLDFSNMLCSCQNQLRKGEPRHCGSKKGDWFDAELLVSPLVFDCEFRFSFGFDGNIKPASTGDDGATETIKRLGLDIPKLIDMRSKAIEPFLDPDLTDEDLNQFITNYLKKDDFGSYGVFLTTIRELSRVLFS